MIQVAPGTKVHLALRPLSMRYGFDGLSAKVVEVLQGDPLGIVLARAMSLATATLPTDPDALRDFAARLQAELYAKTHSWPPIGQGPT